MKEHPQLETTLPKICSQSCLRMRFSSSSCRLCLDVCPHGAIALEETLSINSSLCSGCQLCTAVCPGGALSPDLALPAILNILKRQTPLVICCHKATRDSDLKTPCLAFISEDFLLAIFLSETPVISLDLAGCPSCANSAAIGSLKERLADLEARSGLPLSSKIRLAGSPEQLVVHQEACDRRSFFRTLSRSIICEAATLLSAKAAETPHQAVYAEKKVPLARQLLKTVLENKPEQEQQSIITLMCGSLLRGESCDGCRACTKVCPTGALLENYDESLPPFEFIPINCTSCGLCVEFCINEALRLTVNGKCHE
jgi:ferredoxin